MNWNKLCWISTMDLLDNVENFLGVQDKLGEFLGIFAHELRGTNSELIAWKLGGNFV